MRAFPVIRTTGFASSQPFCIAATKALYCLPTCRASATAGAFALPVIVIVECDYMALKPCPRCKRLIPCGMAYCPTCRQIKDAERQNRRDPQTDAAKQCKAFYKSAAWKRTSVSKLQACEYKCEARLPGCTGMAVEVHHIQPIQTPDGWELRLDFDNLEAVCVHCHNARHRR